MRGDQQGNLVSQLHVDGILTVLIDLDEHAKLPLHIRQQSIVALKIAPICEMADVSGGSLNSKSVKEHPVSMSVGA